MAYQTPAEHLPRLLEKIRDEASRALSPPLTDAAALLAAGIYDALVGPTSAGNATRLAAACVHHGNAEQCAEILRAALAAYDAATL